MATKAKTKEKPAAPVYKVKKQFESGVRADCTKAVGKGATVEQVATRMKIKVGTAKNLVRWLSWNGYLSRA